MPRPIPCAELRHEGGVVDGPGLYALGLPVLRRRKSTFIYGIEDDAREVIATPRGASDRTAVTDPVPGGEAPDGLRV